MNIKIDRRFPFGFKGNWSKCFKKTNYNEKQEITDLLGTSWLFKDAINNLLEGGLINFTSNNINFVGISSTSNKKFYYVTADAQFITAYDKDNGGWQDENYKLINISKTQTNDYYKNVQLIAFFKQNATLLNKQIIEYSRTTYYDVGFDVQLKHIEDGVDKSIINSQPIQNLITKGGYIITKTTDAHFRDDIKDYECIIEINDIVFFENEYWIVEKIDERSIYTPKKQTIYYVIMKNIFKDVIVGVNRSVKEDV